MHNTNNKEILELKWLFSQLDPVNKEYILTILKNLYYAQEVSSQENKSSEEAEPEAIAL